MAYDIVGMNVNFNSFIRAVSSRFMAGTCVFKSTTTRRAFHILICTGGRHIMVAIRYLLSSDTDQLSTLLFKQILHIFFIYQKYRHGSSLL